MATELTAIEESRDRPLGGRYRLDGVVGRGGMGTVYRALDLRLNRTVAIKVLRSVERADADRFEAEIQILARLTHPGLVRLLDAGDLASRPYLVLDLIEGPSLAESVGEGPLDRERTAMVGARVADALAYVHDAGVIHRDVKPANVLLSEDRDAYLADFGIARLVDSTSVTVTGRPLGTPAYLSPEQVEGTRVGPATDVYALGLVLIECLSGRRAFEGSPSEIAGVRLHRDPAVPWEVGEGWRQTLSAMTRRSPADRPSAADAASQLGLLARVDAYIAMITDPWDGVNLTAPLERGDEPALREEATQVLPRTPVMTRERVAAHRHRARRRGRAVTLGVAATALAAGIVASSPWPRSPTPTQGALRSHSLTSSSTPATTPTTVTSSTLAASNVQSQRISTAATALDASIIRGENNGTISVASAEALTAQVGTLLGSVSSTQNQSLVPELARVAQRFQFDVRNGTIVGNATIGSLTSSINDLATAMGTTVTLSTPTPSPPAPGASGQGPNQNRGHGRGR